MLLLQEQNILLLSNNAKNIVICMVYNIVCYGVSSFDIVYYCVIVCFVSIVCIVYNFVLLIQ